MASPTRQQQKKVQHRYGTLPSDELKTITEQSIKDLLAVLVACMEPPEVRPHKADWIAASIHSVIAELEGAYERMAA